MKQKNVTTAIMSASTNKLSVSQQVAGNSLWGIQKNATSVGGIYGHSDGTRLQNAGM